MPFQKGNKFSPGRSVGSKNTKTIYKDYIEELKEQKPDFNPFVFLTSIAEDETQEMNYRLAAAKEVGRYLSPILKQVDIREAEAWERIGKLEEELGT